MLLRRKQNRAARERDLERELRDHLELEADDLAGDADAARRALGNLTAIKEDVRETWGWTSLERLRQDMRYAGRAVARRPAFFVSAMLILALAIGINTAAFSLVKTVVLNPLPFPNADELVMVWKDAPNGTVERTGVAPGDFVDLQQRFQSGEVIAYARRTLDVSGIEEPYRTQAAQISAKFFRTLGVRPVLGRDLLPEDDDARTGPVAILSHGLWLQRFGGNPNVIGAPLILGGIRCTIVGVMGEDFVFPQIDGAGPHFDLWLSLRLTQEELSQRGSGYVRLFARLHPGTPIETAQAELTTIAQQFAAEQPDYFGAKTLTAVPLHRQVAGDVQSLLFVLWGTAISVLLIACANLANMLLTRAVERQRELAVRASLGAGRWRLVRQLLTESVVLALCGGSTGFALAWAILRTLPTMELTQIPRLQELGMDPAVLAFGLVLSLLTGLLFGLYPAWRVSRSNPFQQLREAGRAGDGRRSSILRGGLVVAQVSCSVVLLIAASLLIRSFFTLQGVDTGVRADNVLTFDLSLPRQSYTSERSPAYFDTIRERLAALPQVQEVGAVNFAPLAGVPFSWTYLIEGRPLPDGAPYPRAEFRLATPDFFSAMGVPLIAGRDFSNQDDAGAAAVAVVNESFAQLNWPGENALGKKLQRQGEDGWAEVVGIVGDVRYGPIDEPAPPTMYFSHAQVYERTMTMIVRTAAEPLNLASVVRQEVRAVDPAVLLLNLQPMQSLVAQSLAERRLVMMLLAAFAGLALFLAVFGIYSVVSYSVTQRTPEIGIRIAMGAQAPTVLGMILKQGAVLALTGVTLGIATAVALSSAMSSLVYGVATTDPIAIAVSCAVLTLAALAASYFPARRAARLDPLTALRHG